MGEVRRDRRERGATGEEIEGEGRGSGRGEVGVGSVRIEEDGGGG